MPKSGPVTRCSAYLPAERLLARYPGRLTAINAALAHCYMSMGLPVPLHLLDGRRESNYNVTSLRAEE